MRTWIAVIRSQYSAQFILIGRSIGSEKKGKITKKHCKNWEYCPLSHFFLATCRDTMTLEKILKLCNR